MNEIKVLSGDLDGRQLRQEQRLNPRHSRCNGTRDDEQINEAIAGVDQPRGYTIPCHLWERIFGRRK